MPYTCLQHEVAVAAHQHDRAARFGVREEPVDELDLALARHVAARQVERQVARALRAQLRAAPERERVLERRHEGRAGRRAQRRDAALLAGALGGGLGTPLALRLDLGERRRAVEGQHHCRLWLHATERAVQRLEDANDGRLLVARVSQRAVHERVEVEGDHVGLSRRRAVDLDDRLGSVGLEPRDEARHSHRRRPRAVLADDAPPAAAELVRWRARHRQMVAQRRERH